MAHAPKSTASHATVASMLAALLWAPAHAATSEVSPAGFLVTIRLESRATPHQFYAALSHVGNWWNKEHTWSGDAANLSLATEASACFCERWAGGSVEHARVVYAAKDSTLRLHGALGPLQALAVRGALTFAFAAKDAKTIVQVTYRVAGNAASGLDDLAAPVDGVIGEQARRLVAYVETGNPETAAPK